MDHRRSTFGTIVVAHRTAMRAWTVEMTQQITLDTELIARLVDVNGRCL